MTMDSYAYCPCGSGKKLKWCRPKEIAQIDRLVDLRENRQHAPAIAGIEKLLREPGQPRCLTMYLNVLNLEFHESQWARSQLETEAERLCGEFSEFALPHHVLGKLVFDLLRPDQALEHLLKALSLYPSDQVEVVWPLLLDIHTLYKRLGRPLASWARLRQAYALNPSAPEVQRNLEAFSNDLSLPPFVRKGVSLKSPDEFALFNSDRRERWDRALTAHSDFRLEDLVEAFEGLTKEDPQDASAWFNLGLSRAWSGESFEAFEAFDRYISLEPEFEPACYAAEIAGALHHDPRLDPANALMVWRCPWDPSYEKKLMAHPLIDLWRSALDIEGVVLDAEPPADPARLSESLPPRRIATMGVYSGMLILAASGNADMEFAMHVVESAVGRSLSSEGLLSAMSGQALPFADFHPPRSLKEDEIASWMGPTLTRYIEEQWIHRPMTRLKGVSPLDASGSSKLRPHLEALVRSLETSLEWKPYSYDTRRLRNKLGLPTGLDPRRAPAGIESYSAAQLAALSPKDLGDDELLAAYRTASALDAEETSLQFAEALVNRDRLADRIDLISVFRRLIDQRRETRPSLVPGLIKSAIDLDQRLYGGKNRSALLALQANVLADKDREQEAVETGR